MDVLAVIPARGGSKGIPRKNMRLMHGRPLIEYAIHNALECARITSVAVTSDSEEILAFARQFDGVTALERPLELAGDAVTLDPPVHDALLRMELMRGAPYDAVVTLQPTSPLLTAATLDAALGRFEDLVCEGAADTLISVVNDPHLSWRDAPGDDSGSGDVLGDEAGSGAESANAPGDGSGGYVPTYERRVNRQQLPAEYRETGAFLISCRSCVTPETRLGERVSVFVVPAGEATDIDTPQDWLVCEAALSSKRIVFRADGYPALGMGHIYRCLALAYDLVGHSVTFLCDAAYREGADKLRESNMDVVEVDGDAGVVRWLEANRPDVFVNDTLDTTVDYMAAVRPHVGRLVSFEDLGEGARVADAVVNAIYEGALEHGNVFSGQRYVCLRDEFLAARPRTFSEEVNRVLVAFGGTDPLDLSARLMRFARACNADGVRAAFDFVLGPGYAGTGVENAPEAGITVVRDVARMSDFMARVDLAFSSQGRTTYELAAIGVPTIVLAQNEREQLHTFAQMEHGFVNLGLGSNVSDDDIAKTFEWLIGAPSVRREMHARMLACDLRGGHARVKRIILGDVL